MTENIFPWKYYIKIINQNIYKTGAAKPHR